MKTLTSLTTSCSMLLVASTAVFLGGCTSTEKAAPSADVSTPDYATSTHKEFHADTETIPDQGQRCPPPGTALDSPPVGAVSSPIAKALQSNDADAVNKALSGTDLSEQQWDWVGPYLSSYRCWDLLKIAYDHGFQESGQPGYDYGAEVSTLDDAYGNQNVEAVRLVLAAVNSSTKLPDEHKRDTMLWSWIDYGWPSIELVAVNEQYGITPLSRFPDKPGGRTPLSAAAYNHYTQYLRELLDQQPEGDLPDNLLMEATSGAVSHLKPGNADNPGKARSAAVATIKLLRDRGYDPKAPVEEVSYELVDTPDTDYPETGRRTVVPLDYALENNAPMEVINALQ